MEARLKREIIIVSTLGEIGFLSVNISKFTHTHTKRSVKNFHTARKGSIGVQQRFYSSK